MSNLKIGEKKVKKFNNVGLLIQAVCALFTLVFGIISLIEKEFMVVFEILLCIQLVIIGINNQMIYKKKGMTVLYLLFAVILALSIIFNI